MPIGQYIRKLSGLDQYSPPFPRGGQGVVVTVEVFSVPGGTRFLQLGVEHKNEVDTSWSPFGSFSSISSTGIQTLSLSGCKEMLRLIYRVAGAASQPQTAFYVNVPAQTWRP